MVNPANGANSDTLNSALLEAQMRGTAWSDIDLDCTGRFNTLEVGVASLCLALEPVMPRFDLGSQRSARLQHRTVGLVHSFPLPTPE
jgi:hypothetical protein